MTHSSVQSESVFISSAKVTSIKNGSVENPDSIKNLISFNRTAVLEESRTILDVMSHPVVKLINVASTTVWGHNFIKYWPPHFNIYGE